MVRIERPLTTESLATIELRDVYKVFTSRSKGSRQGFVALGGVNVQVRKGEFVTLVGPSGCGKSTALNMIAGLLQPTSGEVLLRGRRVDGLSVGIGYITQDDNLFPWRTLIENATYGLELQGVPKAARHERAMEYIKRVGLLGFEHHFPDQLSGGMRKRAAIVRTLVCDPDIVLMDEPFGPLDAQTRIILQKDLLDLWEGTGKTIVFVTHDLVESIALSDQVVVFSRAPGKVKSVYQIGLSRPRDVFRIHQTPGFVELYDQLWSDLRDEILV